MSNQEVDSRRKFKNEAKDSEVNCYLFNIKY